MKKRGISVAATLIVCVFVLTIAGFVASVYFDYKTGSDAAASRFEKLSSHTAEISGIYPSGSKEFIDAFNSAVTTPSIFETLKLEIDGIEVYSYPSIPKNKNSAFVKTCNTRIVGGDGARIQLSANIYALSPSMIFNRAKVAFIVILAGTLITCILLMYVYLAEAEKKEQKQKEKTVQNGFDENFAQDYEETALDEDDIDLPDEEDYEEEPAPQQTVVQKAAPKVEVAKPAASAPVATPTPVATPVAAPAPVATPAPAAAVPPAPKPAAESESGEQGLFSPASGFGWESHLNERLESELVRAASCEQDLALVMMKIPGITSESNCYKDICKSILEFFQFKDYIFEYKNDGFAAIIQNKDVDSAMECAESLYANIVSILNKASKNAKPIMGISSRSLRLISVDRLRTEAEQALLHASEDSDSPIVAFRVNPEKYRQYINNQN